MNPRKLREYGEMPAFPCQELNPDGGGNSGLNPGMTLRDWFAGQALAIVANPNLSAPNAGIASMAYSLADEMLKRREQA